MNAPSPGVGYVFAVWMLWAMVVLSVTGKSVSAFSLERANQTLDLLVTTPLTGREIVAGKAAAIRRRGLLALLLLGALFVIGAFVAAYEAPRRAYRHSADFGMFSYLLVAFLSVPIYLNMAGWLAGWIGLRLRKQAHATAIAFGAVFAICVGPFLLAAVFAAFSGFHGDDGILWLFALSPATIVTLTEVGKFEGAFRHTFGTHPAAPILLNWIVCVGIAALFRSLCLSNADRYLGRPVSSGDPE